MCVLFASLLQLQNSDEYGAPYGRTQFYSAVVVQNYFDDLYWNRGEVRKLLIQSDKILIKLIFEIDI